MLSFRPFLTYIYNFCLFELMKIIHFYQAKAQKKMKNANLCCDWVSDLLYFVIRTFQFSSCYYNSGFLFISYLKFIPPIIPWMEAKSPGSADKRKNFYGKQSLSIFKKAPIRFYYRYWKYLAIFFR